MHISKTNNNNEFYNNMRKLNENLYLLVRKGKWWNQKQIKIINKYLNYQIFHPIPKNFVKYAIFGYKDDYGFYEKKAPKYIMFNFDTCNNKRLALRGMAAVSIDGKKTIQGKEINYFTIELIGNKSINNSVALSNKLNKNIKVKSGKDMLDWWKQFGKYSCFKYCKLNAMEDVIGFYWKSGWRFGENFNYFKNKEIRVLENVKALNEINFELKKNPDKLHLLFKRDAILQKYFDKYLEGYYSDSELTDYELRNKDIVDYKLQNTIHLQRFKMRFHGYPMYFNCN